MALDGFANSMAVVTDICTAIAGTIRTLLEVRNHRDATVIALENEHKLAMEQLKLGRISEDHRHQITKSTLEILRQALSELGQDFKTARCGSKRGLSGSNSIV